MTVYGNSKFLKHIPAWEGWEKAYKPSEQVPHSGIYRCTRCNKEITSNKEDKLPPQNHHQHGSNIQLKIIVLQILLVNILTKNKKPVKTLLFLLVLF